MFGESENIRDINNNPTKDTTSAPVSYSPANLSTTSYTKLNKLITALYMVTDIMDREDPIRLKLRTLGTEILLDISISSRTNIKDKIQTVLSFMEIAVSVRLISEMNFNILKREFVLLNLSIKAEVQPKEINHVWLEEFLKPDKTLPRAQTDKTEIAIENGSKPAKTNENAPSILKKQRRDEIMQAIKDQGGDATITEVKSKGSVAIATCGEKTLQRELVSMVRDGILIKTGEKRWSRYSLK